MSNLPPLTQKIAPGAEGGHEFERLMNQLLLRHCDRHDFKYDPTGTRGRDGGVDGLAPKCRLPGLEGPVAFQFKWLSGDLRKGSNARQIQDALEAAVASHPEIRHWVLVTPCDLSTAERTWFDSLNHPPTLDLHHWGQAKIEQLLTNYPALLARYYPEAARRLLDWPEVLDFRQLEADYRRQVGEQHRYVRTVGLPPEALKEDDARADLPLSKLFIPLRLMKDEGSDEISLSDLVNEAQPCVLLGDPGTGKTTLLSFVTLLLTGEATLEGFEPTTRRLPLHVSLRRFVRERHQNAGVSVEEHLARHARSDLSVRGARAEFYESVLAMGEAFVLFDGLDEVGSTEARDEMVRLIRGFRRCYPDCPVWVTSRIYGYRSGPRLPQETFQHLRIAPLSDEDIDGFIQRWYALQRSNPREREEGVRSLRDAIRHSRGVRRLAENPLLLTLMAFIHQGLGTLPQDRGELYDKCVELLLKTWQGFKAGEESIKPLGLHINTQRDYLAHLALHVQELKGRDRDENARGLIPEAETLECLTNRHIRNLRRTDPARATEALAREQMQQFLDYIRDRTGLLIDRGGRQLSFIHLTFQEYLAAWVFTCQPRNDNVAFFIEHLGDPTWEEVLLLRLYVVLWGQGGGGNMAFDAIVGAMLDHLRENDAREGWLTLTRALRDNLEFAAGDRDVILRKAIDSWIADPDGGKEWRDALDEVMHFSEKGRKRLEELLEQGWMGVPISRAVACLHLHARLLSRFPPGAMDKLRRRSDLGGLMPDLVAFMDEPAVAEFLRDRAGIQAWRFGFDAVDSSRLYQLTLDWLVAPAASPPTEAAVVAAIGWLWDKVRDDQRSRKYFAEGKHGSGASLFERNGALVARTPLWGVNRPLVGLRTGQLLAGRPVLRAPSSHSILAAGWFGGRLEVSMAFGVATEAWVVSEMRALLRHLRLEEACILRVTDSGELDVRDFTRDFIRAIIRDFTRDSAHDFVRDFGHACVRSFGHGFVRTFGHDFGRTIVRDVVRDGVRDGVRAFDRSFVRDVVWAFSRDVDRNLVGAFVRAFVRAFGRDIGRVVALSKIRYSDHHFGIDPTAAEWEDQWVRAVEEPKNEDRVLTFLQDDSYVWYLVSVDYDADLLLEQDSRSLHARVQNPFSIFAALTGILDLACLHHLLIIVRDVATQGEGDKSNEDFDKLLDDSLRRNPAEVALAGLAWDHLAEMYAKKHGRLAGPTGALMLAHAGYAALMTGLPCNGEAWQKLLAERDQQDPLIQASWHVHELCHFRDMDAHANTFAAILANPPELLRPLYEGV